MKKLVLISIAIFLSHWTIGQVNQFYESPKGFNKKMQKVAIVGANVRIKNSTRFYNTQGAGGKTWVSLTGLTQEGNQALADWFYDELAKRYSSAGYEVVSTREFVNDDIFLKMTDPGHERVYNNKVFGEATVFSGQKLPFFDFPKMTLGSGYKLSKKIGAALANHVITLDFAYVDQEAGQVVKEYYRGVDKMYLLESNSEVFPVLNLTSKSPGITLSNLTNVDLYANLASHVLEQHGSNFNTTEDIRSELDFVVDATNKNEAGTFYFTLTTTDDLYQKAAKNAITKYLDELFGYLKK